MISMSPVADHRQVPVIRLPFPPAPDVRFAIATELVVSVLALAVVAIVVALTTSYAFGVCRAVEIGGTPIMNTVAAGIQFLPRPAHGDALAVFVVVSRLARLTLVAADQNFLVGASTITQGSRTVRQRDQVARALEADLILACDGQLRAKVRAQIGHTRGRGAGSLNGDVKACTRRRKLGATSSTRGSRNVVRSLTRDFATTRKASSPIQALGCDCVAGLAQDVVAAIGVEIFKCERARSAHGADGRESPFCTSAIPRLENGTCECNRFRGTYRQLTILEGGYGKINCETRR